MQITDTGQATSVAQVAHPPQDRLPLLAVVAHDLRQPTSTALMAAEFADELLSACASAAPVREQLAVIRRCMRQSLRLTQDLLTSGQAAAGAIRLRRAPLDVGSLLHEALALTAIAARTNRVEVQVAPTSAVPAVFADRQRLLQVLSNLCDNAIKFTPPGGTVRLAATSEGTLARIAVVDSGPGVPITSLPRIFDQYWRAEQRTSVGGVGLGLSIARWLVELHGGSIQAVNTPGGGLTVAFTVPLHERAEEQRAAPAIVDG
jgi:signal transduction histidine kinase